MNNYYVYMYMNEGNCPFYIGKGKDSRYKVQDHMSNCQPTLRDEILKVGKDNIKIHFLHRNITNEEAYKWEVYWISYLGRRCNGSGQLVNISDGGESGRLGCEVTKETREKISRTLTGRKHSKEAKLKMSKTFSGKGNGFFDKKHSEETKLKMSESRLMISKNKTKPPIRQEKSKDGS